MSANVAIVDYGLGNLYSVKHACAHVGLRPCITSDPSALLAADAAVLPGVGAFGEAMATLRRLGLADALRDFVAAGKPLVGICLGMQLLMSESEEFGRHRGLELIEGNVVRFADPRLGERRLKVPHISWNAIFRSQPAGGVGDGWAGTLLDGIRDGEPMYFVHSYVVRPAAGAASILSTSIYGDEPFCSSFEHRNITACQFHPERSGPRGLQIYRNLAERIGERRRVREA